ncbi:uroporphyrinogen-III synthase [Polaromonas sp. OV174]|uniref:uroporphyrinogen-III synthase n=1 Tax=Polaromonas sp. OV174 TaxID=1855300 RepID=UPI0008E51740|nr:uroporphyrinogen-III synthase [Polaromonas sp. OV174]SFB79044.1 uroporphyrinogen-III synthase [Polaromonas sp. OV174]
MTASGVAAASVIVTRPGPDAQHWVQQLQASGVTAEALPLIEIAAASSAAQQQALQQAWQSLSGYAACMFVSGHAVTHFFKPNMALAQVERAQSAIETIVRELPASLRYLAPGPGTVAALVAAGIAPAQIDAPAVDASQFDSEALWQQIGQRDWQGLRVLIVRGQSEDAAGAAGSSGRDWLARQWQAAGAQVDFVGVYQRCVPRLSAAQLQRARAASSDGSIWLFSSSEALLNLLRQPELAGVDWRLARAVATHPRIVDSVRAAGWGVVAASRPALKDIRQMLGSIESLYS